MGNTKTTQDTWLGIDVETQSAKVVAVSESGEVVAYSSHPLTSHRQGRRHEQDAGEWWSAVVQARVLHGVAFMERLCFDYLDLLGAPVSGSLTFTGGAVRNPYWCQLRADVLGQTVCTPENAEPAFGMAILASAARAYLANAAKRMVRTAEVIEPRPGRTLRLLESYLRFIRNLEQRDWLPSNLAAHAVASAGQHLTAAENVA